MDRIRWMVLAFMLVTVPAMGCTTNRDIVRGPEPGNLAPDFQLLNVKGQVVSLSDFRGRPVLVNFWTTWCPSCRSELPLFQEIFENEKWKDAGLVILAIDIAESEDTVREFIKETDLTFTVLLDVSRDASLEYYVRGYPTTFLIDKEGVIRLVKLGPFLDIEDIENNIGKIIN